MPFIRFLNILIRIALLQVALNKNELSEKTKLGLAVLPDGSTSLTHQGGLLNLGEARRGLSLAGCDRIYRQQRYKINEQINYFLQMLHYIVGC